MMEVDGRRMAELGGVEWGWAGGGGWDVGVERRWGLWSPYRRTCHSHDALSLSYCNDLRRGTDLSTGSDA